MNSQNILKLGGMMGNDMIRVFLKFFVSVIYCPQFKIFQRRHRKKKIDSSTLMAFHVTPNNLPVDFVCVKDLEIYLNQTHINNRYRDATDNP